jgi:hypothetical protein
MDDNLPPIAAIRTAPAASDAPVDPGAFYIQSNIGNSNWVVAATVVNNEWQVRLARKNGSLGQLWLREDDPRGGCYLKNVGRDGQVLQWNGRGVPCTIVPKDESQPHQLWVPSDWGSWKALYAVNWNQALNVFGYTWDQNNGIGLWEFSGGQPNEIWQLNAENGAITLESMTYDMSRAKVDLSVPPVLNVATTVDNRSGSVPIVAKVKLDRKVTTSRRIVHDTSSETVVRTLTTLGFKGSFEGIVEVSGSTAVERTVTDKLHINDTKMNSNTIQTTLSTEVPVPAHAYFSFAILVRYGRVDVPYTAVVSRVLPGGGKETSTITGTYTNIDMTVQEVIGTDITDGKPKSPSIVEQKDHALEPA